MRRSTMLLVFVSVLVASLSAQCNLSVHFPEIVLSGIDFSFDIHFPAFNGSEAIPESLDVVLYAKGKWSNSNHWLKVMRHGGVNDYSLLVLQARPHPSIIGTGLEEFIYRGDVLCNILNITTHTPDGTATLEHTLGPVTHTLSSGHHYLTVVSYDSYTGEQVCGSYGQRILSVPGWLTVVPPLVTSIVAITFRQVFLALAVGTWLAVLIGHGYNPLTATLRTLDTYIVDSLVDHSHSAILISTLLLGGLIQVVQESGGGIGLANIFSRFASSTRRASLVCFTVALVIFFGDYTSILITGNSLRLVMDRAGVSKDKFAFIVQCMAPSVVSFFPISNWVGAQIGYIQSGFSQCSLKKPIKPFNMIIQTLPYRFLPLLTVFCVLLVCLLNRDFGCMLTAEKKAIKVKEDLLEESTDSTNEDGVSERNQLLMITSESSGLEKESQAPKKEIPPRWFNAVVPFAIVIGVTFLGLAVDGYLHISNHNNKSNEKCFVTTVVFLCLKGAAVCLLRLKVEHFRIKLTVTNIFAEGDALAALIWSTALAIFVLVLMLLAQRIYTFKEIMRHWLVGMKSVIEPLIILMLAWALGNAITEIQTSRFIAQAMNSGDISAKYIPVITVILGCFISYCTGSAYGTMGILFPILIPTVCQLKDGTSNALIQTTAAILASCIFGNLMSPIADLTILTQLSTKCDYNSHLKTCALYVLIIGFISILFGTLPVGAGLYPWWGAWLTMPVVLTLVFAVFSSGHGKNSRSLLRILCSSVYTAYNKLATRLNTKSRLLSRRKHSATHSAEANK